MSELILHDQAWRERFASEIGSNVSLIAPAGVGKTHSIVERIVRLAGPQNPHAADWLPRLVVVTYTKSAAEEMRRRARNAIIRMGTQGAALAHFNRAFFGTIHSFCMMLLQRHGHHLGLPSGLALAEDVEGLWDDFLLRGEWRCGSLHPEALADLFRMVPMLDVLGLGRDAPDLPPCAPGAVPPVDASGLMAFKPSARAAKNVALGQRLVRRWLEDYNAGDPFVPLPEFPGGGEGFRAEWCKTFAMLRAWLGSASWCVAREVAGAFRKFRLSRGQMTYGDQVSLAATLMQHPMAATAIREEGYRVILDEAQDTDREQFIVLTEIAREQCATGIWLDGARGGPGPGRFAMVGDPQQSIYGRRASLASYEALRRKLCDEGGTEVSLDVTFRFNSSIAAFVNDIGPRMLDGLDGQAEYVPLRTLAAGGNVVRWVVRRPTDVELGIAGTAKRATDVPLGRAVAFEVARRLRRHGPARLGASDWSGVAILCPRRIWLETLEEALTEEGIEVQNHSARQSLGGSPAYAWFSALTWVMAEPRDCFEIAGVLREVFGIADADIAEFTGGDGDRLRLVDNEALLGDPAAGGGSVAGTLRRLAGLRTRVAGRPLGEAARAIIEESALVERLAALPHDASDSGMIDTLLFRATAIEEEGLTLAEWSEMLRDGFLADRDGEAVRPGAIQLITCHKAKGLQWDCVVLPFLCRQVKDRNEPYPRLVRLGPTQAPAVVFGSGEIDRAREDALKRSEEQEMQRLFYVAMTRARKTLVLIDDRDVFDRRPKSFFGRGRLEGSAFESLPAELPPLEDSATRRIGCPQESRIQPAVVDWEAAARSAGGFPRRRLPHALAKAQHADEEPEAGLGALADEEVERRRMALAEAANYGIWWHCLMQHLPWHEGASAWQDCLESRIETCPDPCRGRREFERFARSGFIISLSKGAKEFRTEVPFIYNDGSDSCLEGVMDLVVWDGVARDWTVVDWKTNLIQQAAITDLAAYYRPQLLAYTEAIRALGGKAGHPPTVRAYLYSTVAGGEVQI